MTLGHLTLKTLSASARSVLFSLARAERLQPVEDLWDSIALETESSPIPDSQLEEVQRRKARFLANPSSGRTW